VAVPLQAWQVDALVELGYLPSEMRCDREVVRGALIRYMTDRLLKEAPAQFT
jgi:hypothetical protein